MSNDTARGNDRVAAESKSAFDTLGREALILGKPPRIPPLQPDELGKEASETALALRKAATGSSSDEVTEFTATLMRHPALYRCHVALGIQLYRGAMAPRDRELAVLRIGWLCKAPYEWGQHVKIGKQVGVTQAEIERVIHGSQAPGWNEHDRAIIRAVEELIEDAMISDETWAVLSKRLDERQLIELPLLVGNYVAMAYFQNSLRLRLIPGNPGLAAR
jgi:4-carboxymuconolactone decarboxylase